MNMNVSPPEPQCSQIPEKNRLSFLSEKKGLLIVAVAIVVAAAGTLAYQPQSPWMEIIGKDLLRTDAPPEAIARARDAVIGQHQNWVVDKDGKSSDPTYSASGRTWATGPSPDKIETRVVRSKTKITDKDAVTLSIEIISVTETPTLVFIECDDPAKKEAVVNQLMKELAKERVKAR